MTTTEKHPKNQRLNLRATESQVALIRSGAELRGLSLSEFILQSAHHEAQQALLERREFSIPAADMRAFLEALEQPVQDKPRLRRLLQEPGLLDRDE